MSVNKAIRDLIVLGRINATSAMVVAPSLSRAEARSLAVLNTGWQRSAIGLHLTLTGPFRPLTSGFAPLRDAAFPPLRTMMALAFTRRLDAAPLVAEVEAQLRAFVGAFGRAPNFVDGHQHVHLLPEIRDAVLDVVKREAPGAWVRQCGSALPVLRRLGDRKSLVIGWLSRGLRRRARASSVPTNPAFAGTYDFVATAAFADLFPRFLEGLPDGGVIMCHPGFVDAELERLDSLTTLREREYAYFAGESFLPTLATHGVALARPSMN